MGLVRTFAAQSMLFAIQASKYMIAMDNNKLHKIGIHESILITLIEVNKYINK